VAPAIGWLVRTSFNASEFGITPQIAEQMGYPRELEAATASLRQMHKRGIRILPGGDYGFAWMPHGTNANDLQYFVDYIGMTPTEALVSATRLGGEIMMRPDELGQVRPGFLADLVLVDGDPLQNLRILLEPARIAMVMQDGVIHKGLKDSSPVDAAIHVAASEKPLLDKGVQEAVPA
jgi:imidazolonepropionase-like amidohydrolase